MSEGEGEKRATRSTSNVFAKFSKHQLQEFKEGKRAERATSNVFALFKKAQIQEFKEAFTMIDQNRDGIICIDDLREMYNNLGRVPEDKELKEMLAEAPGQLNFTMFLTLMGEKLHGMDPEDALRNAFAMFDAGGKGFIDENYLKELLETTGDIFAKDEVKQTWREIPLEKGCVDSEKFVSLMKGKMEDEELSG